MKEERERLGERKKRDKKCEAESAPCACGIREEQWEEEAGDSCALANCYSNESLLLEMLDDFILASVLVERMSDRQRVTVCLFACKCVCFFFQR